MTGSLIQQVREFNHFYTRVLGLLQPDLAGSSFGLTEARVHYEIAHGQVATAADIRGTGCAAGEGEDGSAVLRLLLVEPSARGMGVGFRARQDRTPSELRQGSCRRVLVT